MKIQANNVRQYLVYALSASVILALVYRGVEYVWRETKPIVVKTIKTVKPEDDAINRGIDRKLRKLEDENVNLRKMLSDMRIPDERFSLRDKLAFVYPYEEGDKFPGYIWQSWKYGLRDERFGAKYKEYEAEWTILNPGFVHELFNDDTSTAIVKYLYRNVPEVVQAYETLPLAIMKVDFFKYLILFAKGGIYADMDSVPLQPIPNWIPDNVDAAGLGMILAVESDIPTRRNVLKGVFAREFQFGNFIMQSKMGHPILRDVIAAITETTLSKDEAELKLYAAEATVNGQNNDIEIMNWTGGGMLTDRVFGYFANYMVSEVYNDISGKDLSALDMPRVIGDILVMPVSSFDAPVGAGAGEDTNNQALARHDRGHLYIPKVPKEEPVKQQV